jgi:Ni/Fe-hydrogenase subunit HybB-like protein
MFFIEIILGVFLPFFLLASAKIRANRKALFYSAALVLLGFVAHRLNTTITSMERWPDRVYLPSWQELSVTFGLIAAGFTIFTFVARTFNIFTVEAHPTAGSRESAEAAIETRVAGLTAESE